MKCPKCGSENVNVQIVSEQKKKHHSAVYWICGGFIIEFMKWLIFTIPMIFIKLFGKEKSKTVHKSMAVCQACGHTWKA